jgi:hypothetical protein
VASIHVGGQQLPGTFSNHFLAHLQVATATRFADGKGYFLTTAHTGDDGEVSVSHWLYPAVPVSFSFDVTDSSGEHVAPVELDHGQVDDLVKAMDTPQGVRGSDGLWWPFTEQL